MLVRSSPRYPWQRRYGDVFTVRYLVVSSRVELRPVRAEPDPVVMRGITMVPKHGVPVEVAART